MTKLLASTPASRRNGASDSRIGVTSIVELRILASRFWEPNRKTDRPRAATAIILSELPESSLSQRRQHGSVVGSRRREYGRAFGVHQSRCNKPMREFLPLRLGQHVYVAELIGIAFRADIDAGLAADALAVTCLRAFQRGDAENLAHNPAEDERFGGSHICRKRVLVDLARLPDQYAE